jgi:hypothetical protein
VPTDRPIIVVGCPRSGTTMLQLMLHAHPRIAIPPETRFLLTCYAARNTFGDLRTEASRRALAGAIVEKRQTLFFDLGLDAEEITEEIVAGPPTLGSALGTVFRAYARRFGKPRWGDKRPGYYDYIPALRRLFPQAQIVHLIRDGRDCVASLLEMPWFRQDIYAAIATWVEAVDRGRRAVEHACVLRRRAAGEGGACDAQRDAGDRDVGVDALEGTDGRAHGDLLGCRRLHRGR